MVDHQDRSDTPEINIGEISTEDTKAAIVALERAAKDARYREELHAEWGNDPNLSSRIRGLIGLLAFHAEHGNNGGKVERLLRAARFISGASVTALKRFDRDA